MLELGHPASLSQMVAHHGRLLAVEQPANGHSDEPLWIPPIVETVAAEETGIDELVEAIARHREHLAGAGVIAALERQQIELELYDRLRDTLIKRFMQSVESGTVAAAIRRVQAREIDPQSAVNSLLESGDNK